MAMTEQVRVPLRWWWQRAVMSAVLGLAITGCAATATVDSTEPSELPAATAPQGDEQADNAPGSQRAEEPIFEPTATPIPEPSPEPTAAAPEPTAGAIDADEDDATDSVVAGSSADNSLIVRLLDAGAEPRQLLRIDLVPSCSELMTIEQSQKIDQVLNGEPSPEAPTIVTIMELRVTTERSGDEYAVTSEVVAVRAIPEQLVDDSLQNLIGMRTLASVDDRGIPTSAPVMEGAEALGPFREMLEGVGQAAANPLPSEPIGVGGSWEVVTNTNVVGVELRQRSVFTVTALDGPIVSLEVDVSQTVPPGSVMAVEDFEFEVTAWDGAGSGEATLDLQAIAPVVSNSRVIADQELTFGPDLTLEQSMEMDARISSSLGDGCDSRPERAP